MKKIIIVNGTTFSGGVTTVQTLNSMTNGALAVINPLSDTLHDGLSALSADFKLAVARTSKTGVKEISVSDLIDYTSMAKFKVKQKKYLAAAAGVIALGKDHVDASSLSLNLPTISVGDQLGIMIANNDAAFEGNYPEQRETYYYEYVQSGDVLTGVLTNNPIVRLIAQINNDPTAICTVTTVVPVADIVGLLFTNKTAGKGFSVVPQTGVLAAADVTVRVPDIASAAALLINNVLCTVAGTAGTSTIAAVRGAATNITTVAMNKGKNTTAKLLELVKEYQPEDGNTDTLGVYNAWNYDQEISASTNYDTYLIQYKTERNSPSVQSQPDVKEILLVVAANAAQETKIEKLFENIIVTD